MADVQASFADAAIASKEIAEKAALRESANAGPGGEKPPSPARKSTRLKLWIYVLAAVALAGAILLWLHFSGGRGNGEVPESTLPLETFVVNLDGSGQRAYLRVGITLGLSRPLARNKEELPIAALRDAILTVLANAKADQLLTAEGKEQLKADLLRALTDRVPQLGIENVYFTEFLVQI